MIIYTVDEVNDFFRSLDIGIRDISPTGSDNSKLGTPTMAIHRDLDKKITDLTKVVKYQQETTDRLILGCVDNKV